MISFIGLKIIKKLQYFIILFHMYSTKFPKAANFPSTDAAPDARLFSHLVRFSKRGVILILSKLTLDSSAMSFHYNSLTYYLTFFAK